MAEYAQKAIEEMLPEVDRMRKIGLFSIEETRAIMKKRQRFEYKTQRRTKDKDTYLQYIQYEIGVQKLIKLRREKRGIEVEKDRIEKPMALRIYRLFRMACFRFKYDVKLWLTHIDFAKKNYDRDRVSKLFTTMLKVHVKKPSLWIMAAKFEFEVNESVETARSLFQRALRLMPEQKKLWIEYFKMELMCVDLIMKRKELLGITDEKEVVEEDSESTNSDKKIEDSILNCKIVEIVFINAIKQLEKNAENKEKIQEAIPDLVFKMVNIANSFSFAAPLIDRMYKFIEENLNLNKFEESWDILARRNLLEEESILQKCEESGQCADFTIAEFEDKANEVFLKAIETFNSEKMHRIYVDFCIERLKLDSKFLKEERFNRLNDAFKKWQTNFELPLNYTNTWIEALINFDKNEEAIQQIENSLIKHSKCHTLWKAYLLIKTGQNRTDLSKSNELFSLFDKAVSSVSQKEAFELWEIMVNWCLALNHEKTEAILKEGSQIMNKNISTFCRLNYLNWSLVNSKKNIVKVRKIYESLRQVPPFAVEFYHKYIEIEKAAEKPDDQRIIVAYEDAIQHFAKVDLDLWIAYIDYVYTKSASKSELENVSNIYWRAVKQLDTELVDNFTQKFCLFKIELDDKNKKITVSHDAYDIEMDK